MHKKTYNKKSNGTYLKSFALLCFSYVLQLNGQSLLTRLSDIDLPENSKDLFSIQTLAEHHLYDPFRPIAEEKIQTYFDYYQWDTINIESSEKTRYLSGTSTPSLPIHIDYIENLWLDKDSAPENYFRFVQKKNFSEERININYLLPPHTWNLNDCNEDCFAQKFNEPLWVANSYESIVQIFNPDFDIEADWGMRKNISINKYSNCFGTAKTIYTPEHNFTFEDPNNFQQYLNEHYEIILPGQKVRFGDVMTFYVKHSNPTTLGDLTLVHAATVISRNFVWGRPSAHPNDKWGFEPITSAYHAQFDQLRGLFNYSTEPWEVRDFFNSFRFIFWRIKTDC